ncbi:hypothetical protein ABIA33_005242 [Streptacidiphilus sp. MAP12-16]|uniref:hypothetical protein n=1 Tax=Streptacidiphilus sp. MAP12-16 TaxID=3156300 RepID=UPI0035119816
MASDPRRPRGVSRRLHYRGGAFPRGGRRGHGHLARRRRRLAVGALTQLTVLALLPLWPFIAYPLERGVLARRRGRPEQGRREPGRRGRPVRVPVRSGTVFLHGVARHPVVIALGAPMRFVAGQMHRPRFGGGRRGGWGGGWGPPPAGDREPRRPKSGPPMDAIALPEPRG